MLDFNAIRNQQLIDLSSHLHRASSDDQMLVPSFNHEVPRLEQPYGFLPLPDLNDQPLWNAFRQLSPRSLEQQVSGFTHDADMRGYFLDFFELMTRQEDRGPAFQVQLS